MTSQPASPSQPDSPSQPANPAQPDPDCIFCKIIAGELPSDTVHRDERVVAFRDIQPAAPTHVLVLPVEHHPDVVSLAAADPELLHAVVTVAGQVAAAEAGGQFRLVFNTGADAGQSVFHAHAHVLAGHPMHFPE